MTAPTSALPLARAITAEAYRAGAKLVTPILSDAEITRARYLHGTDAAFDHAPGWLYDGMAQACSDGAARLALVGEDPFLLSDQKQRPCRPRQPRQCVGLPPGAVAYRWVSDKLVDHRLPDTGLGCTHLPRFARGPRRWRNWPSQLRAPRDWTATTRSPLGPSIMPRWLPAAPR